MVNDREPPRLPRQVYDPPFVFLAPAADEPYLTGCRSALDDWLLRHQLDDLGPGEFLVITQDVLPRAID